MKSFAAYVVVSAFVASSAFGGTVSFELVGVENDIATYNVSVGEAGLPSFDSVNMLLGSDTPGLNLRFTYDDSDGGFLDTATLPPTAPASYLVRASDLFVGGSNGNNTWQAPLLVGQMTADVTGLSRGDVLVEVSSDFERDFGIVPPLSSLTSGSLAPEDLYGIVKLVPEPATLILLGLGGLAVVQRRQA